MTTSDLQKLIAEAIEDGWSAEEIAEAVAREFRVDEARDRVLRAEDHLASETARLSYQDPTGQDSEEYLNDCARDLIDARDEHLRASDPERYAEMKHMGYLR